MSILLPRLSKAGVGKILDAHSGSPPALDERRAQSTYSDLISFAASGGTRSVAPIFGIGDSLRALAGESGFPRLLSKAKFDRESAVYLADHPALQSGEALRNDVWAFLATVVVPDLVVWRFPNPKKERFEGGVRNTFQRLWLRGKALDRGLDHPERWRLVLSMPEDATVAIVERPSLGGRHSVALALAEGWLEMAQSTPLGRHEELMRTATKLLRLHNEIVDLLYLSQSELSDAVRSAFETARSTLGISQPSPVAHAGP